MTGSKVNKIMVADTVGVEVTSTAGVEVANTARVELPNTAEMELANNVEMKSTNTAEVEILTDTHSPPGTINGCPKLLQLDEGDEQVGSLTLLHELWILNTVLLKMVPLKSSLPFVKRLTTYSSSEEELLQNLIALQFLCFYKCEKLQPLPTELYSLPSLLDLCIKDCPKILSLPEKGLPLSLRKIDCLGDVHPTLEEQVEKYNAKRMDKSS
ncbi:hypothetical protein ZIOFF_050445 [Zingiber officinale]|uniref:Uncharacterized protein n=1 Tax=Zingiber officinale TaxID=94328 RepID=A0A8J5FR36_ZINOF|nr:hypothetical protein ZIOFF_050445 [Zingiber officinale]